MKSQRSANRASGPGYRERERELARRQDGEFPGRRKDAYLVAALHATLSVDEQSGG